MSEFHAIFSCFCVERPLDRFVEVTAPVGKLDFFVKLWVFLLICGGLNHLRDVLQSGSDSHSTFWNNYSCRFHRIANVHVDIVANRASEFIAEAAV